MKHELQRRQVLPRGMIARDTLSPQPSTFRAKIGSQFLQP
jgi:hypothetical protein